MPKVGKKAKPHPKPTVVRALMAVTPPTGGSKTVMKSYTQNKLQDVTDREMKAQIASLTPDQAKKFTQLREMCDKGPGCSENEDTITYDDIVQGNVCVEINHAGGEMEPHVADLNTTVNGKRTSHATHSRQDAVQCEVLGFRAQMKAMTDDYIKWGASQGDFRLDSDHTPPAPNEIEGTYKIEVVDIFRTDPSDSMEAQSRLYYTLPGDLPASFSKCFDVYLEILQLVADRIKKVLGRNTPDWWLKNCCPACTYKLEGEMKMIFEMLVAMDGNDSLKRILVKDKRVDKNGAVHSQGKEHNDPRTADAGLVQGDLGHACYVSGTRGKDKAEDTECQEHWKNMSEELIAKMWEIFDETGVFLALCRHSFVLLVANMVRSGELAKYGLAITNQLLQAFGPDLGIGYDIGCGFSSTVRDSSLGPLAEALNLKMLIGAFHGHAHNQSFQLKHLETYVLGLGLEDLEICKRFFSKSNGLPRAVRYASVFHRCQAIATYLAHMDTFETYSNLSTFLINNYKQALEQIDLEDSEQLKQEQEYLQGLSKEPEAETDQMEYYTRLVHLASRKERYDKVHQKGPTANGIACWHAKESYNQAVQAVQEMAALVASRHYCLALNKLEELVIRRLFKLTKMNMSGRGYKLWKHIAKALQTRSKTIRTALEGNAAIRPWATPTARALMDTHFKILRAKEIQWLNIEIRRLVAYIRDKQEFWYHMERGCFDDTHMKRLRKLQATHKEWFTGTLEPGVRRKEPEIPTPMVVDDQQAQREGLEAEMHRVLAGGDGGDNGWETDDGDKELARAIETVVVLATDKDKTD
ncbi:hypothetical protein B0H14DRAFT_2633106 [Mycena olivaceomarginata]|nr:hypothetical protein B0H14DRAFT_2633106 [Mycena olivaceomarginata]